MAKAKTDEKDDLDDAKPSGEERDEAEASEDDESSEDKPAARRTAEADDDEVVDADLSPKVAGERALRASSEEEGVEEGDEEESAAQLGTQRYILAAFFAAGIVGAYVLGKFVHGAWSWAANKDWFHNALPALAAVTDEEKTTYGTVLGAIISIVLVIRTYRRPAVREWADEVASELAKVKWPTRKEVTSSTIVVIAAGAAATIYLALLDRLWSFVTDLFYGTGS